ncbi:MAG: PspC domain-containing protein [Bacteroidota bacterium]
MSTRSRQRRRSDELDRADNLDSDNLDDDELTLRAAEVRSRMSVGDQELADGLYDELYDDVTDEEIEAFLDEQEYEEALSEKKPGFWNLPTAAGISMIGVGTLYSLQQMGLPLWSGLGEIMTVLPWLAGILIILLGFGMLSWSPEKRRKKKRRAEQRRRQQAARRRRERERRQERVASASSSTSSRRRERRDDRREERRASRMERTRSRRKKLAKSKEKKILGVAGGVGQFLGIDPTLVRIAFVLATIFAFPTGIALYILLGFVLPEADESLRDNASKRRAKGRGGSDRDEPFIRVIKD